jgi:2,5-diketo-D-gluconate reductase B
MKFLTTAGIDIPALGLGVWQMEPGQCASLVAEALQIGYRHIDTASAYRNEAQVGEGVRASGVARGDIHVTTKIWRDVMGAGDLQRAAEDSLKRLNMDYVDLLLLHWPNDEIPLEESLGALNEVLQRGLTRAIGVANFPSAMFEQAAALSRAPLATNQVEYHPYLSQRAVLEAARRHSATVTAYSPLAQGALARDPVLAEIGRPHRKSAAQVGLRWFLQQEAVITIPKSGSPQRLRENYDVWDFALSDEEMARISALARPDGRVINPGWSPEWDAD